MENGLDCYNKRHISELLYLYMWVIWEYTEYWGTLGNGTVWKPHLEVFPVVRNCSEVLIWRSGLVYFAVGILCVEILHTYSIQILTELVNERVDWFLDELVAEMEARTGKRVSIPTLRCSWDYAKRMSCYVAHLLLKSALVTCPHNSFSLMKVPKMNALFHADTDIHMWIQELDWE